MMNYKSEILNWIKDGNAELRLSIHKNMMLTKDNCFPLYGNKDSLTKDMYKELSEFVYLEPNDYSNIENLLTLIGKIVLIQYPDSSCWSQHYHMMFVEIVSIDEDNTIKYKPAINLEYCNVPLYETHISQFAASNQYISTSFRLWAHKMDYIGYITKPIGNLILEDAGFIEYMYNPDTIRKYSLGENLFNDCEMFNPTEDFR